MIAHFGSSEQAQPLVTLYMLKKCAQYVKTQLKLPDDPPNDRKLPSKVFANPILITSLIPYRVCQMAWKCTRATLDTTLGCHQHSGAGDHQVYVHICG